MNPRRAPAPWTEQELMERLARGDETAIRAIYQRFARLVFAIGLRLLGSREAAEELTQDVFMTAWRKAGQYDASRGRLPTWLITIAHNAAVDRLRRGVDGMPRTAPRLEESGAVEQSEQDAILDRAEVHGILRILSPPERKLIDLAYFQGWSAREIAESETIPVGTVKTRLRAVLIKLRRVHGEEGGWD